MKKKKHFSAVYKMQCQKNDVTNTHMGRQYVLNHIKIKMYSLFILTDFDLLKIIQFDTIYAALNLGHNLWHILYERNGSRAKSCPNGRQVNFAQDPLRSDIDVQQKNEIHLLYL